jgi:pimeloyl-ACP methyl ester carboxylesterase
MKIKSTCLFRAAMFAVLVGGLWSGTSFAQTPPTDPLRASSDAVIDALKKNDLPAVEARFDARMHELLPHDKFVATGDKIREQVGALQRCDTPTVQHRSGLTVFKYRCQFDATSLDVTIGWNAQGELSGLFFLPVAAAASKESLPSGMREEALTTGAPGWPLPATLLMPTTVKGPVPVALLVHGSGPNDRDETIGPNKPFRDLAIGLAKQGIATLRYEKRTRAHGERFIAGLKDWTIDDEIVDDAVAALTQLAQRKDVGPIFVIGHSEGALFAPRIAERAAERGVPIAGIVMLAAPLTPLDDVLVYQYEFLAAESGSGMTASMVDNVKAQRDHVDALLARSKGRSIADAIADPANRGLDLPLDWPASAWLDLGRYDPAATLATSLRPPALLTFGGRDFQVRFQEKALWESAIGWRPDTTLVAFPTLNHLLIEGEGPPSPAEYNRAGHVSAMLIDRVGAWITQHATVAHP